MSDTNAYKILALSIDELRNVRFALENRLDWLIEKRQKSPTESEYYTEQIGAVLDVLTKMGAF